MGEKHELNILALSASETDPGQYTLVLEDSLLKIRIPVIIGHIEAQSIAIVLEKVKPSRPLTHDLLKNALDVLEVQLIEVVIYRFSDNVFYSYLELEKPDGAQFRLDSRTSDAIALAVRYDVPIYSFTSIIEEAGFLSENFPPNSRKGSIAQYTIEELEDLLARVIAKEDYESAARIRDYLEKRKTKS